MNAVKAAKVLSAAAVAPALLRWRMALPLLLATALCASVPLLAHAQGTPAAQTPTGICKDGSNYFGATKKGACAGHGGVKEWHGAAASAPAAPAAAAPAAPSAAPAAKAIPPAPAGTMAKPAAAAAAPATTAAVGGAPGQVWANKSSKVYHCPGSHYYGKTKDGAYMSEAEAKAQGFRPDHNKACG